MPRSLRLPPELEAGIKRLADLHDRSENSEIVVAIRQYLHQYEEMEASEHDDDISPEEFAAECEALHPGISHEEYKKIQKGSSR